jgi:hypothetical protein
MMRWLVPPSAPPLSTKTFSATVDPSGDVRELKTKFSPPQLARPIAIKNRLADAVLIFRLKLVKVSDQHRPIAHFCSRSATGELCVGTKSALASRHYSPPA